AVSDLNADRRLDVVVSNFFENSVSVLLANGDGTLGADTQFETGGGGPRSVTVGDLNGDGRQDLVVGLNYPTTFSVLLGKGDGTFGPHAELESAGSPIDLAIADDN